MPIRCLTWSCLTLVLLAAADVASATTQWSSATHRLVPGDFNGDGNDDVLYIAKDLGGVSGIALSDGVGPNVNHQVWDAGHLGISWRDDLYVPIAADFSGDGKDDLLMQAVSSASSHLIITDVEGKLSAISQTIAATHLGQNWSTDQHRIIAGDFNGDGKADLFLQGAKRNIANAVYLANAGGQFTSGPQQTWPDSFLGFRWTAPSARIYAGDFDADGKADLFIQAKPDIALIDYEIPIPVPTFRPNSFGVVPGRAANGSGQLFYGPALQFWNRNFQGGDWSANLFGAIVADFNGDGRTDIFLQSQTSNRANQLFLTNVNGQFASANVVPSGAANWTADQYVLRAINVNGSGASELYVQAVAATGTNYIATNVASSASTTTHQPIAPAVVPSSGNAVGRTAGAFDVSTQGEAFYRVPLWTPPGVNGLTPSLSLEYASTASNGWLGMGFSIPALSIISRCNRTIAQDGASGTFAPAFSQYDKFCIDGSRLRLVSGGTYGGSDTTYQTELESFRRITIKGADSYGPTWFEVHAANGLIYEYGNSPDSLIRLINGSGGLSSVRVYWALNRIRDRSNNYIDFTYAQDAVRGGYYPQEIRWTGNTNGRAPKYKVVFVNEAVDRTDVVSSAMPYWGPGAIGLFNYHKRLSRIDVRYIPTDQVVRRYQLTYVPAPGNSARSMLQSLQECGLDGTQCLAASNFTWFQPTVGTVNENIQQNFPAGVTPLAMDINGDSRDDLVWSSTATSGTGFWFYKLANTTGGFGSTQNSAIPNNGYLSAQVIEWDGDGKQDLITPYGSGKWWVLRANGSGFDAALMTTADATFPAAFADIDGDGRDDFVRKNGGLYVRLRSGANFGSETLGVVPNGPVQQIYPINSKKRQDFDGDGLEDLVFQYDQIDGAGNHRFKVQVVHGAGTGLRLGVDYNEVTYVGSGDFNGDQRSDLAYLGGGVVRTSIVSGPQAGNGHFIADWDGDGKDDLLVSYSAGWSFARSTGTSFEEGVSVPLSGAAIQAADFDGDGYPDILALNGSTVQSLHHTSSSPWVYHELLKSAVDGFGVSASFAYGQLSDALVHTPAATPGSYPQRNVVTPTVVVKSVTATDGATVGSNFNSIFSYEGAREDITGRGFVGFAKRTVQDSRMPQLRTEYTYEQSYPLIGATKSITLKQNASGQIVRQVSNTWDVVSYGSGVEARAFPYVRVSTSDSYELGGLQSGVKYSTATATVAAIDSASGLTTDVTTTVTELATGLDAAAAKSHRVRITSLLNDSTNWCIGRPQAIELTNSHTLAGGTSTQRRQARTWDAVKCRATQEQSEPGDANWQVTTAFTYDDDPGDAQADAGNVTKITVTGAGMPARQMQFDWGTSRQFLRSITNALSETTLQDFREDLGVQTSITDPNGLAINWDHDAFGRLFREQRPDGTRTLFTLSKCSWCDPRARYTVTEDLQTPEQAILRTNVVHLDQFDRSIWSYEQLETGAYSASAQFFDSKGRLRDAYAPFWQGGANSGYRHFSYDDLDRVVSEQLYTSSGVLDRQTSYSYEGLALVTTDPKSRQSKRITRAWGDVARTSDAASSNTNYRYDAFGQLTQVNDAYDNVVSSVSYNIRGMKMSHTDLDAGAWTYQPNALGEVRNIRDAKTTAPNWTTNIDYDLLGRMISRQDVAEGVSSIWTWGRLQDNTAAAKYVGRLKSVCNVALCNAAYSEVYSYDSLGRPATRSITSDATHQFDYTYDSSTGQIGTLTYPTSTAGVRLKVRYGYTRGFMSSVQDQTGGVAGTTYWSLNGVDPRSQISDESYGNGVRVVSGYEPLTGLLSSRQAGVGGGGGIQNLNFQWDKNNHLTLRQDARQGLTETVSYDNLDRFDYSQLNGVTNLDLAYDSVGSITQRSDVGSYGYHPTKKHAATSAGSSSFAYDANGNQQTRTGSTVSWYSYNLPNTITGPGGSSSQFLYTPDRERWKQTASYGGTSETTIYIGGLVEKVALGGVTSWKHYIATPSGPVALVIRKSSGGVQEVRYLTSDHQGSINSITNETGGVVARLAYDAFGRRRNEAGWSGNPTSSDWSAITAVTRRGYTGHEMLDNLSLIHMNGRVYDQINGRFTSADPYVPDASDGQSFNRYSYVVNNPLTYSDPSGFAPGPDGPPGRGGDGYVYSQDTGYGYPHGFVPLSDDVGYVSFWTKNPPGALLEKAVRRSADFNVAQSPVAAVSGRSTVGGFGAAIGDFFGSFSYFTVNFRARRFSACRNDGSGCLDFSNGFDQGDANGMAGAINSLFLMTPISLESRSVSIGSYAARPVLAADEAAFHYTFSRFVSSIERQGLRPGSYATPNGSLSPLQAHIDLALSPNRGLPDALLRIDLAGLRRAGYQIPDVTQVGRSFGMPGGGYEMQFPYSIPSEFITVIRP